MGQRANPTDLELAATIAAGARRRDRPAVHLDERSREREADAQPAAARLNPPGEPPASALTPTRAGR